MRLVEETPSEAILEEVVQLVGGGPGLICAVGSGTELPSIATVCPCNLRVGLRGSL
jgi:hypothetical protein